MRFQIDLFRKVRLPICSAHLVTCILITYLHFTETGLGIDIGSRIIKAELDGANGIELVIDGKRVSVV